MTIHLDWGEAEFWQQYESVNESVIATADAAARLGGSGAVLKRVRFDWFAYPACAAPQYGERNQTRDKSCGPTDFGS
jgi:hypothetical protein